jgi:predicted patatin/cPLA2 family phospholipase
MRVKKGLVLEGGGLRGNYTAGVLDALLEAAVEFPYIIGVSAGAGMGCSFVSRQRGRNLEILKRYRENPRYLSFRNYLKTGSIFGMDFVFHTIPEKLIPFDYTTFTAAASRFVTVCTDCTTGEAVYYEKDHLSPEDFYRILEASASMPYVAPMVSYGGRQLLDGAIVDAIPLVKAVEAGFSRNVCVLTNPAGYRKKEEPHPPNGLFYHGRKKLARALGQRVRSYNAALAHVEGEAEAGRAVIIRPSRDLHVSRVEKSMKKLLELYELGLADGREALGRIIA